MKNLVIRSAQVDDLDGIRRVIEEWQDNADGSLRPIEESIQGDKDWKFFVAEDQGKIVGVMGLATSDLEQAVWAAGTYG